MIGLGSDLHLFATTLPADVAGFHQLLLDLHQILLGESHIQGRLHRFQMFDFSPGFSQQGGYSLEGPLELAIFVKIFFRVLLSREGRIERNRNLFIGVIIQSLHGLCAFRYAITVGVNQFSPDLILLPLFCIGQLSALQIVFLTAALQGCLHDTPEIRGLLADARQGIFCGVVAFQQGGNGVESLVGQIPVHGQRNRGELCRIQILPSLWKYGIGGGVCIFIINMRLKITSLNRLHKP